MRRIERRQPKNKRFEYYRSGRTLAETNIAIDEMLHPGETRKTTRYRVRYTCCGKSAELTHQQIQHRMHDGSAQCNSCAKSKASVTQATIRAKEAEARKREDAIAGRRPDWPVPSWVPVGKHVIWSDRMREGMA